MTDATDITQLCCSPNLAGTVADKIEQSFYSIYSYSRIGESLFTFFASLAYVPLLLLELQNRLF